MMIGDLVHQVGAGRKTDCGFSSSRSDTDDDFTSEGYLMSTRNLCASILAGFLLATGLGGLAPAADAAPAGHSLLNPGDTAKTSVIQVKKRHGGGGKGYGKGHGYGFKHRPRFYFRSIAPSYLYYDYPYYYSRGYYPYHIGPGLIYPYTIEYGDDDYVDDAGGVPYSAKERCDRRFKSFEWDTGLYTTYGGQKKLCPYLR